MPRPFRARAPRRVSARALLRPGGFAAGVGGIARGGPPLSRALPTLPGLGERRERAWT